MAEISNLILSAVPKVSNTAGAEPAEAGNKPQQNEFSTLLASRIAERHDAKSGKSLPQSGHETARDNADHAGLRSHQLKSGLTLMVGGETPSLDAVSAFAESQGINPAALKLLLGEKDQAESLDQATLQLNGLPFSDSGTEATDTFFAGQVNGHQPQGDDLLAAWIANSAGADNSAAKQLSAGAVEIKPPLELLAQQQQMASQGLKAIVADSKGMVGTMVKQQPTDQAAAIALSAKQLVEAVKQASQEGSSKEPVLATQIETTIKANASAVAPVADLAGKLLFKEPQVKNIATKWQGQDKTAHISPALKLDAINLTMPSASAAPVTFGESAFLAAQHSSAEILNKPLPERLPEDAMQQAMRKQDESTEMSRRLTEALGQRLAAQITRGAWRVEMDLHPKSLGRIEIQLEMKNGELEANFHAANSATRELLAESMPRLRSALEEHGMETAYIGLEMANQGKSDGKSTAQQQLQSESGTSVDEEPEALKVTREISDNGLDVLV
jgi:flagellar hook-length control protein FliK